MSDFGKGHMPLSTGTGHPLGCHAIVRWPHSGKQRMRYRRNILPFTGASGAPQLISGTADDVNIDLRIKSSPESALAAVLVPRQGTFGTIRAGSCGAGNSDDREHGWL